MLIKNEGRLQFDFPERWTVSKYDDWSFQKQFQNICGGAKAVDFLALSPQNTTWLIEVKDYRVDRRTKPSDLPYEIACKFRDTLAGSACARVNSNDANEKRVANAALQTSKIRLVLHLEQPRQHSKLFPRICDPADIKQKLKTMVKAIDPHPLVVDMNSDQDVAWQVTSIKKERV